MNDRFKNWMKEELDFEWSSATFRRLNPTATADITTISKRIVSKDKMTRIDLNQKIAKLRRHVHQKQNGFQRVHRKFPVEEVSNNQAWNVFASLLENCTDSHAGQGVFQVEPESLDSDETFKELETGLKVWQKFQDDPKHYNLIEDSSQANPSVLESYENVINEIPGELKQIAEVVSSITGLLFESTENNSNNDNSLKNSMKNSPEDSAESGKKFKSDLIEWSKLFQ